MGISSRIKQIQDHYQLSAASFADSIRVQRSSISHIVSGRNKPSLDFVLKIIDHYPEVDISWLLRGEGTFPKKTANTNEEPDLFNTASTYENIEAASISKNETSTLDKVIQKTGIKPPNELYTSTKNKEDSRLPLSETTKPSTIANTKKQISRVIIFYTDGSFENFES
ncbi:MAG: helix-turn-helix domain-containing protein [Flavobacteriaceae bacterium]|nr:helix-turn-helix domain-containing protein [Flavobacteriaceae bacterium]